MRTEACRIMKNVFWVVLGVKIGECWGCGNNRDGNWCWSWNWLRNMDGEGSMCTFVLNEQNTFVDMNGEQFFFLYENVETILELWRKYFHTCREWVERFIVKIFRMWQKPRPSWILSTCLQAEKYAKKRWGGNKEKNISCRIKCSPAIIPNEMVTRGLRCVVAALLPSPREKQI